MARPGQPPDRRQASWSAAEQPARFRAASGASASPGRSPSLGQSPGPPLPAIPAAPAAGEAAWGPRPMLWSAAARFRSVSSEKPRQERDSLRHRSLEGRAGSRKNKRWVTDRMLTQTLRRAMEACGEDAADLEGLLERGGPVPAHHPSVFYDLLQSEGPENALEALDSAEAASRGPRRARSRPRHGESAQIAEGQVRRAFSDTWQYVRACSPARELLTQLEAGAARAFGAPDAPADEEAWQVAWDGDAKELDTMAGQPPAGEMEIYGLTAPERKVAHQLARVLGLHSESHECDELVAEVLGGDRKAVTWRPPRTRRERAGLPGGGPWSPPFSVSRVLLAAA